MDSRVGIFFYRKDNWAEVNNWPKGHRKARLAADGGSPFGDYTIHEARAKVEDFISKTKAHSLQYESFAILPMPREDLSEGLNEFEKLALRKEEAKTKKLKEEEMARADGRVKCFAKGCKNYVMPPRTLCGTHDGTGEFSTHPAEGLPITAAQPEAIEPDLGLAADEAPFDGPREVTIRRATPSRNLAAEIAEGLNTQHHPDSGPIPASKSQEKRLATQQQPGRKRGVITEAQKAEVIRVYQAGTESVYEIEEVTGVYHVAVRALLREAGIYKEKRGRGITPSA